MSKYLTYEERLEIQLGLKEKISFGGIGRQIGKDRTTIAKKIKEHSYEKKSGYSGWPYNTCRYRLSCKMKGVCKKENCSHPSTPYCKLCRSCTNE